MTRSNTARGLAAVALLGTAVLLAPGCSSEGTLTVKLLQRSDEGSLTLSDVEAFVVSEPAFRNFRANHTERFYRQALELQEELQAGNDRVREVTDRALSARSYLDQRAASDAIGTVIDEANAVQARYRTLKREFHDKLTAEGLRMTPEDATTFSATIPKKERQVVVLWGTPTALGPQERYYWVGWVSLHGERQRTITMNVTNPVGIFPFREPPMTW